MSGVLYQWCPRTTLEKLNTISPWFAIQLLTSLPITQHVNTQTQCIGEVYRYEVVF